jgi:hypothetical protein
MSIAVSIITIANRVRRFTQHDEAAIEAVFETLRRPSQLFSNRTLIIGSDRETEIFSPASITRIEIETAQDLSAYLPPPADARFTLIPVGVKPPPAELSDSHSASAAQVFFRGGDMVTLWLDAPRPKVVNERLMRLSRLFELPVIVYALPAGGVGFINPAVMTRTLLTSGLEQLPVGSWKLDPLSHSTQEC